MLESRPAHVEQLLAQLQGTPAATTAAASHTAELERRVAELEKSAKTINGPSVMLPKWNDGAVTGGELEDFTLGLNWYLNPNTRMMFNYVRANVDRQDLQLDDTADIFEVRFQLAF